MGRKLLYLGIFIWIIGCSDLEIGQKPWVDLWRQLKTWAIGGVDQDVDQVKVRRRQMAAKRAPKAAFEGGSIGSVQKTSPRSYDLWLRSDNDGDFPKYWRQWWHVRLDDLPVGLPVSLTLKGRGHWNYYLPVYSYDGSTWRQFAPGEVSQPSRLTLRMKKAFRAKRVWLARYHPYTYSDLLRFLRTIKSRPHVRLVSLGASPLGYSTPMDPSTAAKDKRRVVIHGRTHPGEVGSSWLLEGLLDYLARADGYARLLRRQLIFHIVPMVNVDGVIVGNNRVSPKGINLEGQWNSLPASPYLLDQRKTPREVLLLHRAVVRLDQKDGPITMALNIHASNGTPQDRTFFFPHFGPRWLGYGPAESRLWQKQMRFIRLFKNVQGEGWFNPLPKEGGRAFIRKDVPESWWWRHARDSVMALTVEAAYGLAARGERWMQPRDFHKLGRSMAVAIGHYHLVRDRQHPGLSRPWPAGGEKKVAH